MWGRKKRIRRNTYKARSQNRRGTLLPRIWTTVRLALLAALFGLYNLGLILGHDWITQTEHLGIRTIAVSGCHRLSPQAVKAQAGLTAAGNILAVNLTTTRKRLLAHPWIAEARVTRDIPDRLEIHIREHTGLAVLDLGRRFLLSDTGQVFKELADDERADVPVVTGLTYTDLGLQADDPTPVLRAVLTLLQPRQRDAWKPMVTRIRAIHADPALGLTVFLDAPGLAQGYRSVMLGFGDFDQKYATLTKIDGYLRNRRHDAGFQTIDLKNLNRIIVQPEATGAAEDARKEV